MSSNDISSKKEQSKTVMCKNCRQDILAEKMFLHEGFCSRNNVFCEHCEKVFLKKDYNYHIKNLSKKENEKKDEANIDNKNKIRTINIYRSPVITKKNTHFEYIEMPIVEQYTIRNPIIISENGQILSNKNKNEFLLPYFGINNVQNNNISSDEFFKNDILLNEEEILKESHAFITNNNGILNDIVLEGTMRNSVSTGNLNVRNSNQLDGSLKVNNQTDNKDEIGPKNNIINLEIDGSINNKIGFFNKSQSLTNIKNDNDKLVEDNYIHKNRISLSNDNHNYISKEMNNINSYSISNSNNIDGKVNSQSSKKNNIIINNNIITYNSNNNINKIHNFFSKENVQNKKFYTENNINYTQETLSKVPKDKETATFNPTRISSGEDVKKFRKKLKKNILNNNLKTSPKEPYDSRTNKIVPSLNEKIPLNSKNNKYNSFKPKPQSLENKAYKKRRIKCDFCDKYCDDLVLHYKLCHLKKNNGVLKPRKRDTVLLNEKLNSDSIDEMGIDESKQKILLRQFRSTFHTGTISDYKNEEHPINKNSIEHPINKNKKNEKKGFPEDSKRNDMLKTQGRNYRRKKIEEPLNNDKNIKSESRFSLKRMVISFQNSPVIKKTQVVFNNEKIRKKVSISPRNVRERISIDKISNV